MTKVRRPEQISILDLLPDVWRTPLLPPEDQKEGVKAWILECDRITNSNKWNAPILYWRVRARRVKFDEDAKFDRRRGKWEASGDSCDGLPFMGRGGYVKDPTFAVKPCFGDIVKFVERQREYRPGTPIKPWE